MSERIEKALQAAALAILAAAVSVVLFVEGMTQLFSAWVSVRLGFSGLLAAGLPLYPARSQPAVGDIYGPMAAVFYLPSLVGSSITADILLAEAWTFATVGGLLVVSCLWRGRQSVAGSLVVWHVALVGLCVMAALPGLRHCVMEAHADAPSLVLGALSCLVWRGAERFDYKRGTISAVCFGLSLWSKQSALPILLAQVVVLAFMFGRRAALVQAVLGASSAFFSFYALCVVTGERTDLAWFYLVRVPFAHQLVLTDAAWVLGRVAAVVLPALALIGGLLAAWSGARSKSSESDLDVRLLAAVGVVMVPPSIWGTLKVGGYLNNIHAHYYLLLACCLAAVDALGTRATSVAIPRRALTAATLLALLLLPSDFSVDLSEAVARAGRLDQNPHQLAYDYAREHEDAYFPWHPLSVVQAQGRAYTSFDALRTLAQARIYVHPSAGNVFPEATRYVAFPTESQGGGIQDTLFMLSRTFPGYVRMAAPPAGLEAFAVFAKPDDAAP